MSSPGAATSGCSLKIHQTETKEELTRIKIKDHFTLRMLSAITCGPLDEKDAMNGAVILTVTALSITAFGALNCQIAC